MLRLVLLVLYLVATTATSQTKHGSGLDPLGLAAPTPPPQIDGGGGIDPLG